MFVSIFKSLEFGPIDLEQTSVDLLVFDVDLNLDAYMVQFIGDRGVVRRNYKVLIVDK